MIDCIYSNPNYCMITKTPKICPLAYKKMVTYLIPRARMANQVPEISSRKLSLMETRLKKKQS